MKKLLLTLFPFWFYAQPNCNAFLYEGDTLQYKACMLVENIENKHYQFRREFQEKYDEALEICPHFAYAYREKSTAYLKSGDFLTWKRLIDKAVEYDISGNLGYRAWCRFQFFRDYKGAIADIEKLDNLSDYDIGYGINGDYHLNITKAMCYSALNQKEKAISIFISHLVTDSYAPGLYDYYQLGVTYYENKNYDKALQAFEKQTTINDFAENAYYAAKVYLALKNDSEYKRYKAMAIYLYGQNKILSDPYTHHYSHVYYTTILNE